MAKSWWVRLALGVLGMMVLFIALSIFFVLAGDSSLETEQAATAIATTAPAETELQLVVSSPGSRDLVTSPLLVAGQSSVSEVGYRLLGSGQFLAEGVTVIGNDDAHSFSVEVDFTNACCIEMTLEVFQIMADSSDGLTISIPLTYPEPG